MGIWYKLQVFKHVLYPILPRDIRKWIPLAVSFSPMLYSEMWLCSQDQVPQPQTVPGKVSTQNMVES